jgi:sulfate adenylyltransferase subunit 1 (EFTu-like GTPase family)
VDIARGDIITHATEAPRVLRRFGARVVWMDRDALTAGRRYWLKHGTQTVRATVESLESRLDLDTMQPTNAHSLEFNDIGAVRIAVARPIAADPYAANRATGSFILIDEATHRTAGAGMIDG